MSRIETGFFSNYRIKDKKRDSKFSLVYGEKKLHSFIRGEIDRGRYIKRKSDKLADHNGATSHCA